MFTMSLKVPYIYKLPSDLISKNYSDSYDLISTSLNDAINLAINYSEYGIKEKSMLKYKGAMICLYLLFYTSIIKKEYSYGSSTITKEYLYEKYKIQCVKDNLLCLGKTYGINFSKLLNDLLTIEGEFKINEFIETEITEKNIL